MEVKAEKLIGGTLHHYDIAKSINGRLSNLGLPEQASNSIYERINADLSKGRALCQSPIEILCLEGLLCADYKGFLTCPVPIHSPRHDDEFPEGDLVIIPQFAIARYRLDFAVLAKIDKSSIIVGVECDGNEFHNGTREQYIKDKNRDAYLENFGIKTFRITGSQLYRNQVSAVYPVSSFLSEWKSCNG